MSAYEAKTVTVTTTAQAVVVADSDVDREVVITANGAQAPRVGFNSTDSALLPNSPFSFMLPADEDLYMRVDSGSTNVSFIVTKA